MAVNKTQPNNKSVADYMNAIDDKQKPSCEIIYQMMAEATGETAKMWGDSLVGFGQYHYQYESGRAGNWFLTGFSARKNAITLYIMPGFSEYSALLAKLGKYKLGRSCLYIKSVEQVDQAVLMQLIQLSVDFMRAKHH